MECNNLEYRRRLPPELLVEMHKCLPLDKAIYVLVNVSNTFVINNSTRMLRTIQGLKTSLKEHIETLVEAEEQIDKEEENDPEELVIRNIIEWKPQMDALLHYGTWLTSTRELYFRNIGGVPENFVEKLLLHLANSSSTQMTLKIADICFAFGTQIPTPTFLKPIFNEKQFRVGNGFVFESVELKMEDGRTIYIHDGELFKEWIVEYKKLRLFVQNKMNGNEWFEITMNLDYSKEFIYRMKFTQWKMQSLEDVRKFIQEGDNSFKERDGNILEAKKSISYDPNLDLFLRRGAKFTQFRHLKINKLYHLRYCPDDYVDFLINFVSNAKHPKEFLESIDFDLFEECSSSIKKIWEICQKGIPKAGKQFGKKLHILSGKTTKLEKRSWVDYGFPRKFGEYSLEFTLANIPTDGEYLFDICVEFGNGIKHIFGIKIQKRKIANIVELKCDDQIEKKYGMKKKASNDDGKGEPTCSLF